MSAGGIYPVTLVGRIKPWLQIKGHQCPPTVIGQNHANINNLKITCRSEDFFDMTIDIEVNGHTPP